jgi:hypothetical protein
VTNPSGPGSGDELQWEDWQSKPVITRHVEFTGFDEDTGNGWLLLNWLHDRNIEAYGRGGIIYFHTTERPEAIAHPGYWFIIGTQGETYAITPEVHADKYVRVQR